MSRRRRRRQGPDSRGRRGAVAAGLSLFVLTVSATMAQNRGEAAGAPEPREDSAGSWGESLLADTAAAETTRETSRAGNQAAGPIPAVAGLPAGGPRTADDTTASGADSRNPGSTSPPDSNRLTVALQSRGRPCAAGCETAWQCARGEPGLLLLETGFAGFREGALSLEAFHSATFRSRYNSSWTASPYGAGGAVKPGAYTLERGLLGGLEVRETWAVPTGLDTPITSLFWERGAFGMNQFHLQVQRLFFGRSYLDFGFSSVGSDSQSYGYSFQVHQPYLSGVAGLSSLFPFLERDSTSLVIQGVQGASDARHFRPLVGLVLDTNTLVEAWWDLFSNQSQLPSPLSDSLDNGLFVEAAQSPQDAKYAHSALGAGLQMRRGSWRGEGRLAHTAWDSREAWNSILEPSSSTAQSLDYSGNVQEAQVQLTGPPSWLSPRLRLEVLNEFVDGPLFFSPPRFESTGSPAGSQKTGWADRERAGLELRSRLGFLDLGTEARIDRHGTMEDRVHTLPGFSVRTRAQGPLDVYLEGEYLRDEGLPGWRLAYATGQAGAYPSPGLEPWLRNLVTLRSGWEGPRARLGLRFTREVRGDAPLPPSLPFATADPAPDSSAGRLVNYDREMRSLWGLTADASLGNWSAGFEGAFLLQSAVRDGRWLSGTRANPMLPRAATKGHLAWSDRFVSRRLRVGVRWDWEWLHDRFAWQRGEDGSSQPVKLEEFLALDFTAEMQIKTFTLYYRIKNFNHDRYQIEPGSHPPGVNFRWGASWILTG